MNRKNDAYELADGSMLKIWEDGEVTIYPSFDTSQCAHTVVCRIANVPGWFVCSWVLDPVDMHTPVCAYPEYGPFPTAKAALAALRVSS
jgi:hypothetical protein